MATFTLTGTYHTLHGIPAQGKVLISASSVIADETGNVIFSGKASVELDDAGSFTVALPAPGTGIRPTEFGYTVQPVLGPHTAQPVTFAPPAAGTTLDLADVAETWVTPVPESTAVRAETAATNAETAEAGAVLAKTQAEAARDAAQAAEAGATAPTDTQMAAKINDTSSQTRAALSATYATKQEIATTSDVFKATPLEFVPFVGFGHSYLAGPASHGSDTGTRFFERIARRFGTQTYVNRGVSGNYMYQTLANVEANWTAGTRGLVGIMSVINDCGNYGDTAGATTTAEAFRAILARLTAKKIGSATDTGFSYGTGWVSQSSSVAGSYVDLAWRGDTVYLSVARVTSTGGTLTVQNQAGATVATINTGGFKHAFNGVTKLSGFGAGDHVVRVTLTSGSATIAGYMVPSETPPVVVWCKEGPVVGTSYAAKNDLLANTYLPACQTVANDFPSVFAVEPTGWDRYSMNSPDLLHLNDYGNAYWADRISEVLSKLAFRQGLNQLTSATNGASAYTVPAVLYSGTASAPSAPTNVAGTTGNQISVTWTQGNNGGAPITAQTVQWSPAGANTWTTASSTIDPGATSYTITSGLTENSNYDIRVSATNSVGQGAWGQTVTAVKAGPVPVQITTYAADDFNRSDGPMGNTPTGNLPWQVVTKGSGSSSAEIVAQEAKWKTIGSEGDLFVDTGQANGTVKATLVPVNIAAGLIFRMGGTNNQTGYVFWHNGNGSVYKLSKRTESGSYVDIYTATRTNAANDVAEVVLNGTSITLKVNGATLTTLTDASYTGTRHGMWAYALGARYDNFSHTSATS